jgi:outer membrane protein
MMPIRQILIALFVLSLPLSEALAQTKSPAATKASQASMAIIDLRVIIQNSAAARSIREQIDKQGQSYQTELARRQADLQKQQQDLQAQQATLSPDAFAVKRRTFEDEVAALQRQTNARKDQLQLAADDAMKNVRTNVDQLLEQMKPERGVDLIVYAESVAMADPQYDLTSELLRRLDAKLSHVTVKFPAVKP